MSRRAARRRWRHDICKNRDCKNRDICGRGAIDAGQSENLQKILFGSLIVYFLVKEPNGLAALIAKFRRRLSLWPFKS